MKLQRKTTITSAILLLTGILVGAILVQAQNPTSTFYLSSGIYPGAPSYTIWKEGSYYYAKNAFGKIDSASTNLTVVWEAIVADDLHVHFTSGLFTVVASLQIYDLYNFTLTGAGSSTILQASPSLETPIIEVNGTDSAHLLRGLTISNLKLLGASSGVPARQNCLQLNYVCYSEISHLTILRSRGHGIYAYYCTGSYPVGGLRVFDCEIWENIGGHAIYFNSVADAQIFNCKIVGSGGVDSYKYGVFIVSSSMVSLANCQIDTNVGHGVFILDSNLCLISGNLIYDNDFLDTNSYDGININTSNNNTIVNNAVYSNDRYDIHVSDAASTYNMIVGCSTITTDHVAGIIDNGTGTEIHSCWNGTSWIT